MRNLLHKKLFRETGLLVIIGFAILGLAFTLLSNAATSVVNSEAENGTVDSPASLITDSTASSGKAVQFKSAPVVAPASCTSTNVIKATTANGFRDLPSSGSIYSNRSTSANLRVDASGTTWRYGLINKSDASQIYGVMLDGGDGVCWSGGRIVATSIDKDNPIWETWHDLNGFRIGGIKNFIFENLYIRNFGDLLNISDGNGKISDGFVIRDSLLRHAHDDCLQNDKMASGKIINSFLDGCYSGISARMSSSDASGSTINGSGKLLEIENTLMWMQPMTPVYKGTNPGHGGFFKWENDILSRAMNLSLKNVVLMARQGANHQSLGNEAGSKLTRCENVTIIWLGSGSFPGTGWPSGCVTVVTGTAGRNLWLQKTAEWYASHPQFADLKPADDYYFSYNP